VSPSLLPRDRDPVRPAAGRPITLRIDGERVDGLGGQTIAGVLLGSGLLSWRRTSTSGEPRGLLCGIGVCFDCILTVNGERDVRACQRRATDGDELTTQHDALPGADARVIRTEGTSRAGAEGPDATRGPAAGA